MKDPLSLDALSALDDHLSEEERMVRDTVRRFIRERYLPRAGEMYEKEQFPTDLIAEMADMGLLGAGLHGYGCAGMNAVQYGLILQELEYGDSGLRSFASVQGSLAMYPIHAYGSEAQKEKFLPPMAQGKLIGCFGLTEPDSGSDPGSMKTRARKDGSDWILNGTKMWITNSPFADLAVVWAKTEGDDPKSVQGFVVERGMKGFETPRVHGKMSLRSSETGEITLDDCRVPDANRLPGVRGLRGPLGCLTQARFGIAWGANGAAKACFEAALDYARKRVQFGVPIASKQLIQAHFADMAAEIVKGDILTLHYARMKDRGGITPVQVSL
jgi:glutaryl-CoA dehydrogenase